MERLCCAALGGGLDARVLVGRGDRVVTARGGDIEGLEIWTCEIAAGAVWLLVGFILFEKNLGDAGGEPVCAFAVVGVGGFVEDGVEALEEVVRAGGWSAGEKSGLVERPSTGGVFGEVDGWLA